MKGGGRFKLVHSKGRISNRGGGRRKKEVETEMRTRGINLTQGMEFRDKISRSLKFYGGWFSVLFVIAGRNAHAVTFSK